MADPSYQLVFLAVELVAIVWLLRRRPEPLREMVRMAEQHLPWEIAFMTLMPAHAAMSLAGAGPPSRRRDRADRRDMREVYRLDDNDHYPIDDRRID